MPETIEVAAGALFDTTGRVLIAERLPGTHMAGYWEFPGGKIASGETPEVALARELNEELGVTVTEAQPLIRVTHAYPDRRVVLHVFSVDAYRGTPGCQEGQSLKWVVPSALCDQRLLPADAPIVDALRLPDKCLVTPWDTTLVELISGIRRAAASGIRLIQLRTGIAVDELARRADELLAACDGAQLVINGNPREVSDLATALDAGIHVPARFLTELEELKHRPWPIGASCHDETELARAAAAGANFALLGPVSPTASHRDVATLGWDGFGQIVLNANLPVFGIGGLGDRDVAAAKRAGGHGIAAIQGLWR